MQREQLPRQLRSDEIPGGAWCNRLLASVKAIWPVETPTVRPITTADGTGYQAKQVGGGSACNGDGTRQDNFTTPEGTETADTDDWDITDQGSNAGVKIQVTTRVVYDDTSNETLYGFYRTLEFDGCGALVAASAETRYTINAPDLCS